MTFPLISIIIINYNGKKWLKECLDSCYKQSYKKFEVILVDNASTDQSLALVRKYFSKVKIIHNKKNFGFAKGNNIGVSTAKGQYIFLLNNDTVIDKNCLANLLTFFEKRSTIGSVQPKLLRMSNKKYLDQCGSYWTDSTYLYHYGYGKNADKQKYNTAMPFFSNMGAAMMIKKRLIEEIGLFDNDFWCYYEETDFCHRAWLAGFECWYYPKSIVYHSKGGTSILFDNSLIQFHNYKNKVCSYLKNFQLRSLITILPTFVITGIFISTLLLLKGKRKEAFVFYQALYWNIVHLKSTLEKRKKIQKTRTKKDKEIFNLVKKNPRLSYYFYLFKGLEHYEDTR